MINLTAMQQEVSTWSNHNFGNGPSWRSLLGIQEEVGELSHAYLKRDQQIRGEPAQHREDMIDALGDIVIYMMNFCADEDIDLESVILETWATVRQRDWKANSQTGQVQQ